MAWRFKADADNHILSANVPGGDATACGFVMQSVNTATFAFPFGFDDNTTGAASQNWYFETTVDGKSMATSWHNTGGGGATGSVIVVIVPYTWYFLCLRRSGTTLTGYARQVGGGNWLKQSTTTSGTIVPTRFRIGGNAAVFPGEFWNGRVCGVRLWDLALTDSEIFRESYQLAPATRRHRLVAAWLDQGYDTNGKARNLTKGTAAQESDPPVPRFSNQPTILKRVNAAASQGVLSAPGDSTASFVGASTATSVLSGAGDASGAFVGKSLAASVLSAAGDATATFTGKALDAAVLSAPGAASATFVGRSTAASVLSASADATGAFIGRSDAAAVWAASATAAGDFIGTSQVAGDSTLSASGDSTGIFVGQSLAASVLQAVAAANADWRGDFTVPVDTSIDGSGMRFVGRRAARKRTPQDIAREQKMVQEYLDELERKEALAQVPGAATPGTRAAEAGSQGVEPATSVKGTEVASPAPVLHAVARVNALQRMAELEEEALEAERNEQQQQRRRAAASAVLLMSF